MASSEPCPFCLIATAFPPPAARTSIVDKPAAGSHELSNSSSLAVPRAPDSMLCSPRCFLLLSTADTLAFLDIMPLARGHVLVATRAHREKIGDLRAREGKDIGFWLPLVSQAVARATGVLDYNIVQNNGIQAAQVVPHVHFHIIPRPNRTSESQPKSFTMFGRGQRTDLDEEEAEALAADIRKELAELCAASDGSKCDDGARVKL